MAEQTVEVQTKWQKPNRKNMRQSSIKLPIPLSDRLRQFSLKRKIYINDIAADAFHNYLQTYDI